MRKILPKIYISALATGLSTFSGCFDHSICTNCTTLLKPTVNLFY